jgi:hypothetical protein
VVLAIAGVLALLGFGLVLTAKSSQPMAVKFKTGETVKILYVAPGTSSEEATWNYDGSPSDEHAPWKYGDRFEAKAPGGGKRLIQIGFEIGGRPIVEHVQWQSGTMATPAKLGGIISRGSSKLGKTITACYGFTVPASWKTADLEVALPFGAFKPAAEYKNGGGALKIKRVAFNPRLMSPIVNGRLRTGHEPDMTDFEFEVPPEVKDQEWYLAAWDKSGTPIRLFTSYGGTIDKNGVETGTWRALCFDGMNNIDRIAIQARNYEWTTVKGIHLYPASGNDHR